MAPFTKTNLGLPILMQSLLFIIHIVEHYQMCKGYPDRGFSYMARIYLWSQSSFLLSVCPFEKLSLCVPVSFCAAAEKCWLHSHIYSAHTHTHTQYTHTHTTEHTYIPTFSLLMCEPKVSSHNDRNWPAVPPSLSLLLSLYPPLSVPFPLSLHCRLGRLTNDFRSRQRRRLT